MARPDLTPRQAAEAIEQFGDDLAALNIAFDRLCDRMAFDQIERVNHIAHQERLETIAEAFRKLGSEISEECDAASEADDRRRANPLAQDFRRIA